MKEEIRQQALALGFEACRFTTADQPDGHAHFQQWLAARRHGEMTYLERNAAKRINPQRVLPEAKTIVSLAASYGVPQAREGTLRPTRSSVGRAVPGEPHFPGVVARYACFADYHTVLGQRLKALSAFVNQVSGSPTQSLWYVDTGPVLERDLAQRAGLGFIGKHTNLINRRLGNWFFLGQIITTLELEPDPLERNRCGSCTRCLTACPTQAIVAPFELDARRCISYLTIELKGSIPLEFRPAVGNRIFGCDDCLAVCPWNRFAREGSIMKGHARPDLATPDLIELLSLDEAGFRRRFGGTPLQRVKRRGLLRNVCVALGNTADGSALPALERAIQAPEPLIAEHARWAMERIRSRQTLCRSAQSLADRLYRPLNG